MKKYYIDTAIWRDLHENRQDKFRPLGEWAFQFIKKIIEKKDVVLYSELVVDELSKDYNEQEIKQIFEIVASTNLLNYVYINNNQIAEAKKLAKIIPFADALHAILARDNNAILITRDRHFESLYGFVEIHKPEELL
jgi:predicted nucleic acid-binding protein